jgi:hypothetical protein
MKYRFLMKEDEREKDPRKGIRSVHRGTKRRSTVRQKGEKRRSQEAEEQHEGKDDSRPLKVLESGRMMSGCLVSTRAHNL